MIIPTNREEHWNYDKYANTSLTSISQHLHAEFWVTNSFE